MSKIHGKDAAVYLDKYDISGEANSVTLDIANDVAEVSAFQDTFKQFVEGIPGWSISLDGFFDGADAQIDEITEAILGGGGKLFGVYPEGEAVTKWGYEGQGVLSGRPITVPIAGAVTLGLTLQGDGLLSRVMVLEYEAKTSTGDGASRDFGGAGSDKVTGVLRVLVVSGSGTIDVKIQEDDNVEFTSPTDIITFTQASALTAERKQSASAGERYLRAVWTIAGFTSVTILVSAENK